jgi:hypothetical protein
MAAYRRDTRATPGSSQHAGLLLHERAVRPSRADDERDAFHPLFGTKCTGNGWSRRQGRSDRLQQVWFTGMHPTWEADIRREPQLRRCSDDGEASGGVAHATVIKDRILALASSYGPIHDSRSGVAPTIATNRENRRLARSSRRPTSAARPGDHRR